MRVYDVFTNNDDILVNSVYNYTCFYLVSRGRAIFDNCIPISSNMKSHLPVLNTV